jgi:hypothetical protein
MLRIIVISIASAFLAACGSSKEMRAKHQAMLDANKIPEVQLTPEQIKALTAIAKKSYLHKDEATVAWARAGRLNDGTTFVCWVTKAPDLIKIRDTILVHTGTFQADGSYKPTPPTLFAGKTEPIQRCQEKGFDPPVHVRVY